jgi:hypothetical protein
MELPQWNFHNEVQNDMRNFHNEKSGTSTTIFTGKSTVVEVPLFSLWKFLEPIKIYLQKTSKVSM